FATLFSAISTAFVILSFGDLKPDYAKQSAQALLIMSRTHAATSNNYSAPLPAQIISDTATFLPPRSAVVVNVLLLLSLSLSVVVSLFAMLGKEWCYKFMSGRSGQVYEQARRRQKRWNGIELWKMREVLMYLPGVMHLALLLFATGLSVYLWNIDINMAAPVISVTGLTTLLYLIMTILPVIDPFCPYSTPLTVILEQTHVLFRDLRTGAFRIISYLLRKVDYPQWLKSRLRTTYNRLRSKDCNSIFDGSTINSAEVPMDIVTSQMLAWLLANCEDSQSISTALQAIAGARPNLLHAPLAQCGVYELVVSRLNACTRMDHNLEQYCVKDISTLPMALGYCRSFSALISGDAYACPWDNWKIRTTKSKIMKRELEDLQITRVHLDLLQQAEVTRCDFNTLATGTAAAMQYCHWAETRTNPAPRHIAPKLAASILSEHLQDTGRVLSAPALHMLVESTAHYLAPIWIGEKRDNPRSMLTLQIAKVYLASHATAPSTACAAAVALAAAAFLADSYAGGEPLPPSSEGREKRAVQVLRYYQTNKPTNRTMSSLFAFGFAGLLSSLDFKSLLGEITLMPALLAAAAGYIAQNAQLRGEVDIHTLPPSIPLGDYLTLSACRSLLLVTHHNFDHANEPAIGSIYTNFMLPNLDIACADNRLYISALKALCYAQSNDLHNLCLKILGAQPVPAHLPQYLVLLKDHNILERLCDTSLSSTVAPIVSAAATLHFKLLIAAIILSTEPQLEDRQSLLRPITNCRHEFAGLKPSIPDHSLPENQSLLLHIQQSSPGELSIQETMLRTMQYAVDFCHADPKLNPPASEESSTLDWRAKLQGVKDAHRLSSQFVGPSNVELPNFGPVNIGPQGADLPNYGRPNAKCTNAQLSNQTGWPNQTGLSPLNNSQPTPQFTPNAEAPQAGHLNANPPYTNLYADPNPWHPTRIPDRPGTPYVGIPKPDHYQPGLRPAAASSLGGPQAPHPYSKYPYPMRSNNRPFPPMQPWHSNMMPSEPYQPTQNSALNVPAPWQQSNQPVNDYPPGHITMPTTEHHAHVHGRNNHSPTTGWPEIRAESPVATQEQPIQDFEL
ncbi:hypothetical protein FS749_005503, partial [Ceratobasidium sp. UAMH 11750]